MRFRSDESLSRESSKSARNLPTNRDVPRRHVFAILVKTPGRAVDQDPRCGVARKRIAETESVTLRYSLCSRLAIISA